MGCCVSSDSSNRSPHSDSSPTTRNRGSTTHPPRSSISKVKATENRAPPPPLEEETVKEVLSAETPKWKPKLSKFEALVQDPPQKLPKSLDKFQRESTKVENYEEEEAFATTINKGEEISEVSEVCSLSESVSTTTFNEEEARQRVNRSPAKMHKNRSFSGELSTRRDRVVGKSPARSEQSPARKNGGAVRVVQSRDQMGNGMTRSQPRRRDSGDNSGRRSRSPATRTDSGAVRPVVGRSPSARRGTNQSPARIRTTKPAPENGGRIMENSAPGSNKWPPSANESLENPLVSLECFIFL